MSASLRGVRSPARGDAACDIGGAVRSAGHENPRLLLRLGHSRPCQPDADDEPDPDHADDGEKQHRLALRLGMSVARRWAAAAEPASDILVVTRERRAGGARRAAGCLIVRPERRKRGIAHRVLVAGASALDVALELRARRPFVVQRRRGDRLDRRGGRKLTRAGARHDAPYFIRFRLPASALARCSIHQRWRRLVAWTRAHTFTCPSRSAASVSSRSEGWARWLSLSIRDVSTWMTYADF